MNRTPRTWLIVAVLLSLFSFGFNDPDPPRGLVSPVNMTVDNNRLFVSDRVTGLHVFNIADPVEPVFQMRIPLRSNHGTAVRGDIVYTNDGGSLLAIRVTGDSYEVVKEIKREPLFFEGSAPPIDDGGSYFACACVTHQASVTAPSAPAGGGSSFDTFAAIDDYLYYIDGGGLVTADISIPEDPQKLSRVYVGDIETLYPTDQYLFIGGMRGMKILDRSDPAMPSVVGGVAHFRACDPVVVKDQIAFVTLRGGNQCGAAPDVLLCVDVADPYNPTVVGEKPMETPYGLAIDRTLLYVSSGKKGFELLDVGDPSDPVRVQAWQDRPTRDFVWQGSLLYTLTFDGLLIFDVSNPKMPVLLSEIRSGATS